MSEEEAVERDVEELLGELAEYDDLETMLEEIVDDVDLDDVERIDSLDSAFED